MRLDLGGSARGHSLDLHRGLHFAQHVVGYEHAPVVIV